MKRSFVGLFWSSGTLLLNGFTVAALLPKSHLIVYKIKGTDVVPHVSLAQVRVLVTWYSWAVSVLAFLYIFTQYLFNQHYPSSVLRSKSIFLITFTLTNSICFLHVAAERAVMWGIMVSFCETSIVCMQHYVVNDISLVCGWISSAQSLQKCHKHPEAFNKLPEWISGDCISQEDKTLFSGSLGTSWKWNRGTTVYIYIYMFL